MEHFNVGVRLYASPKILKRIVKKLFHCKTVQEFNACGWYDKDFIINFAQYAKIPFFKPTKYWGRSSDDIHIHSYKEYCSIPLWCWKCERLISPEYIGLNKFRVYAHCQYCDLANCCLSFEFKDEGIEPVYESVWFNFVKKFKVEKLEIIYDSNYWKTAGVKTLICEHQFDQLQYRWERYYLDNLDSTSKYNANEFWGDVIKKFSSLYPSVEIPDDCLKSLESFYSYSNVFSAEITNLKLEWIIHKVLNDTNECFSDVTEMEDIKDFLMTRIKK